MATAKTTAKAAPVAETREDVPDNTLPGEPPPPESTEPPTVISLPPLPVIGVPQDQPPRVPVKYIGRHEQTKDSIYNTGAWVRGQVKLVEASLATRMFNHVDAYVPVGQEEAKSALTEQVRDIVDADARAIDEAAMTEAVESLRPLNKEKLAEYAAVHYGRKLDQRMSEEGMRKQVADFIYQYGAI